jgi:glycosyltransferase involved in cell wall biosynthesis
VAQLFLDADLVALPYTEASQSGVLNLAAAFGKPTIVTDVGELRATVELCEIGLVVPPNNPEQLAEAIALVAEHRDIRVKLGANARKWAEGANSLDNVGRQAASLYQRVLQQKQGS